MNEARFTDTGPGWVIGDRVITLDLSPNTDGNWVRLRVNGDESSRSLERHDEFDGTRSLRINDTIRFEARRAVPHRNIALHDKHFHKAVLKSLLYGGVAFVLAIVIAVAISLSTGIRPGLVGGLVVAPVFYAASIPFRQKRSIHTEIRVLVDDQPGDGWLVTRVEAAPVKFEMSSPQLLQSLTVRLPEWRAAPVAAGESDDIYDLVSQQAIRGVVTMSSGELWANAEGLLYLDGGMWASTFTTPERSPSVTRRQLSPIDLENSMSRRSHRHRWSDVTEATLGRELLLYHVLRLRMRDGSSVQYRWKIHAGVQASIGLIAATLGDRLQDKR